MMTAEIEQEVTEVTVYWELINAVSLVYRIGNSDRCHMSILYDGWEYTAGHLAIRYAKALARALLSLAEGDRVGAEDTVTEAEKIWEALDEWDFETVTRSLKEGGPYKSLV